MEFGQASSKSLLQFLELVGQLDAIEFFGVAEILTVPINTEEIEERGLPVMREFEDILSDVIDKFITLRRPQRKQLLRMLKDTIKIKNKERNYDAPDSEQKE